MSALWLKRFIIVISVILCFYQVFDLSERFFRGEVLTEIQVESPKTLTFPAFTLCFPFSSLLSLKGLLNYQKLAINLSNNYGLKLTPNGIHDSIAAMMMKYGDEAVFGNLTVRQLFEISHEFSEIASIRKIPSPKDGSPIFNQSEIWGKHCTHRKYCKGRSICFTVQCFDSSTVFNVDDIMRNNLGFLVTLNIAQVILRRTAFFELYIHKSGTLVRGIKSVSSVVSRKLEPTLYMVSYQRTMSEILPSPYETDCFTYQESRDAVLEDCQNNLAREKFGFTFQETARFPDCDEPLFENMNSFESESRKIRQNCEEHHYRPDCVTEIYAPLTTVGGNLSTDRSQIVLEVSRTPQVIKRCEPKTPFSEYLTLVCSVFGFWFGFSVTGGLIVALSTASNKEILKSIKRKPKATEAEKGKDNEGLNTQL